MKKKMSHPIWIPVLLTSVSTAILFLVAEYVFHIPSRFFESQSQQIADDSWTPKVVPPSLPPALSGSVENAKVVCTMEYAPVCGVDAHDYSNECMAGVGGTTVAYVGNCIKENEKVVSTGAILSGSIVAVVSGERDISLYESGSYHIYENKTFGYKLALPKYAYYMGFGKNSPSNTYGADHILAVSLSSTGAESLDLAEVRVVILKSNPGLVIDGKIVDLANGTRVFIVADETNPKIKKIVDTILESVQ